MFLTPYFYELYKAPKRNYQSFSWTTKEETKSEQATLGGFVLDSSSNVYVLELEAPGADKKDIKIRNTEHNMLELSFENRKKTKSFRKTLSLPEDSNPEEIKAKYEDGILRIEIGKTKKSKEYKEITVE